MKIIFAVVLAGLGFLPFVSIDTLTNQAYADCPPFCANSTGGSSPLIPDWVRNNAGWWAAGQISDEDFVNGIEYLINNGLIVVSTTSPTCVEGDIVVPEWIKLGAGTWAAGGITDGEFLNFIEWLINHGIICV